MNKNILTGALAALTFGGALAATTTPAAAYDRGWHGGGYAHGGYYGGGYGRGFGYGAAALTGLAVGAALAGPAYYGPACRIQMRWNPYWGNYERVRVCY
jgi:hypothetical protein